MPSTHDLKPWQLDIWEIRAIDRKLCGGIVVLPAEPTKPSPGYRWAWELFESQDDD